ncbi:hypothetical protein L6164_018533 [Bauhinia variegata]|uniref:Uncharacterized protein n=1 Tax=Bauhinia variegata TaxID=167791 RepID=A0ACB9NCW0_BAUVA|nr:hypothetical protein L6164_018533 [Bauhinia variegata]
MGSFKRLAVYSLLLSFIRISSTLSILTPTQPIRDGTNETLVSAGGTFEAGFFSISNSKSHYVGIWYKSISPRTVVWVANREEPLTDSSGVFQVNSDGLSIINSRGGRIWSSNLSKTIEKPVVQLLESGNLVVKDRQNLESILWQSFDHPGDTFLPGMKLGRNFKTGQSLALTSWKNLDDPSPGEFSMGIDTHGLPQLVVTKGGSTVYRAGSWNGLSFTGTPTLNYSYMKFVFVLNEEEVFYENEILNSSILMRSRLTPEGYPFRLTWSNQKTSWDTHYSSNMDECENYGLCGANTNCNPRGTKVCECLTGFTAKSQDSNGSFGGCGRTTQQVCNKGDRFQKYEGKKLPDTSSSWYDKTISLRECEKLCLSNCSCTAYANLNISGGGSGCLHWFDYIMDMRELPEGGQDFYLRLLAGSELNIISSFHMTLAFSSCFS